MTYLIYIMIAIPFHRWIYRTELHRWQAVSIDIFIHVCISICVSMSICVSGSICVSMSICMVKCVTCCSSKLLDCDCTLPQVTALKKIICWLPSVGQDWSGTLPTPPISLLMIMHARHRQDWSIDYPSFFCFHSIKEIV